MILAPTHQAATRGLRPNRARWEPTSCRRGSGVSSAGGFLAQSRDRSTVGMPEVQLHQREFEVFRPHASVAQPHSHIAVFAAIASMVFVKTVDALQILTPGSGIRTVKHTESPSQPVEQRLGPGVAVQSPTMSFCARIAGREIPGVENFPERISSLVSDRKTSAFT